MAHLNTILLLWNWGRWGAIHIGYPSFCPMLGERALKTPLFAEGYIPPDVLDIENATRRIEPVERRLLLHKYQWRSTLAETAERFGCSYSQARRKIERAEDAVHAAYCGPTCGSGRKVVFSRTIEKLSEGPG